MCTMPADAGSTTPASLSAAELAEKLEKSEAGRKKLRQAISLMQEKLQDTENVLKVNETLRLECETEKERVEEEKKKAEEEKRLRCLLEKDSATFRDQLAKVLQRLGVLETKQKSNKKEVECLHNEVRGAVNGVSAAAEAIKSIQRSFQTLEHSVLQKVNSAFDKANVASEESKKAQQSVRNLENEISEKTDMAFQEAGNAMRTVKLLQQSLHSLENKAVERADEKLSTAETNQISEKLVAGITQLFNKERKTHRKIEHQLAALKTMLKSSRSDSIIPAKLSLPEKGKCKESKRDKHKESITKGKRTGFANHEKPQALEKRKLMKEDELSNWVANKKRKLDDVDVRNPLYKIDIEGKNEPKKGSMRSPHYKSSEHAGLSSRKLSEYDVSRNFSIGASLPEHMNILNQNDSLQASDCQHQMTCKEGQFAFSANKQEGVRRSTDEIVQRRRHESSVYGKGSTNAIDTNCLYECKYSSLECSDDDVDDDWWPGDTTPLSPTLPEIHFPCQHIQSASMKESMSNVEKPIVDLHSESIPKEACFLRVNELDSISPRNTFKGPEIGSLEADDSEEIKLNPMAECKIIADNAALCVDNSFSENTSIDGSLVIKRSSPNFAYAGSGNICTDSKMQNVNVGSRTDMPDFTTETQGSASIPDSTIQNGQNPPKIDVVIDPGYIVSHVCDVSVTELVTISANTMMKDIGSQKCSKAFPSDAGNASDCFGFGSNGDNNASSKPACLLDLEAHTLDEENKPQHLAISSVESIQNHSNPSPSINRALEQNAACFARHIDSSNETISVPEALMEDIGTASHLLGQEKMEPKINDHEFEAIDANMIDQMNYFVEDLPSILQSDTCLPNTLSDAQKLSYLVEKATDNVSLVENGEKWLNVSENISSPSAQLQEMSGDKEISSFTQMSGMLEKEEILQTESTQLHHEKIKLLETATTACIQSNDFCKMWLLQAFDFEKLEVKTKVIEACVNTVELSGYFSQAYADSGIKLPEKALSLRRDCAEIPIQIITCCLISIVVSLVKGFKGEDEYIEAEEIISLVTVFIMFIRTVFTDAASLFLENVFAQLGNLLYGSKVMLLTSKNLESSSIVVPDTVNTDSISFEYSEATLEDIYAGSKVLAGLCQVLSCVTHLQNVVYELLGCCDKDTIWLLTVFSSFASICGNTAFVVDTDDILGRAISAIVIELVVNFQQEISEHEETPLTINSNLLKGLEVLINILDLRRKLTVADVFSEAMASLQQVLGSCESLIANSITTQKASCNEDSKPDSSYIQSSHCKETEVSRIHKDEDNDTSFHTRQREMDFEMLKIWQKKYSESVGALELIAVFMGWEWTYNHLIIRCLWRKIVSGPGQIVVSGIMHAITVLVRNAVSSLGEESPGVRELRTWTAHNLYSRVWKLHPSTQSD